MTFYRRPTKLTQMMNGALGWLASLGLTPSHMITLEVKGRRSGQTRSTVMNLVGYEGARYAVSPRGESEWVRNVRAAAGAATIRHRGRRSVRLEEVPSVQRAPILKKYLARTRCRRSSTSGSTRRPTSRSSRRSRDGTRCSGS